ncbi:MAG: ATP-grasp domain-containing protein [Candidatus Bathyarchaeota archaeon]|nr:ATP-grasp domain-containing protein [Candidatus Bathyarchaeota archaeon]
MKIVVYEHVCGGGYATQPVPSSVLAEGFAMLRGVTEDLSAAGYEVTVILDKRLFKLDPTLTVAHKKIVSNSGEVQPLIASLAQINDATLIIAPETNHTLESLVKLVEATGKPVLNSPSSIIAITADKISLNTRLQKTGVLPDTSVIETDAPLSEIAKAAHKLGYPVVLKPSDGVSCGGLSVVKDQTQLDAARAKIKAESQNKKFILQKFIEGESVSVSLICNGKTAVPLTLNQQFLALEGPDGASSYMGGVVPFEHPQKAAAICTASRVCEDLAGLRGYVGVDLILAKGGVFVVDVNARLTTSYVGLRKVAAFNVADALMAAVLHGKLPEKSETCGFAAFMKINVPKPSMSAFEATTQETMVVTPPFPLDDSETCGLVMGEGKTAEEAAAALEEAKKHLRNITS